MNGEPEAAPSAEETRSSENLEEVSSNRSIAATVASKSPLDADSVVFECTGCRTKVDTTSFDDHLADIYLQLKRVLAVGQTATLVDAVWRWRFDYYNHWGSISRTRSRLFTVSCA